MLLQVIEKLTNCMQKIIAENQNNFSNNNSTHKDSEPQVCLSPVYSLADEDRTQCLEDPSTVGNIDPITEQIETIDICNDDDARQCQININVDIEMHGTVSNSSFHPLLKQPCSPSILDSVEHSNLNSGIDCSQSILKDFQHIDNTRMQTDPTQPQKLWNESNINKTKFQIPIKYNKIGKKKTAITNGSEIVPSGHGYAVKNISETDTTLTKTEPIKKKTRKRATKTEQKKGENKNNRPKKRNQNKSKHTNDTQHEYASNANLVNNKKGVQEAKPQELLTGKFDLNGNLTSQLVSDRKTANNPVPKAAVLPGSHKPMFGFSNNGVANVSVPETNPQTITIAHVGAEPFAFYRMNTTISSTVANSVSNQILSMPTKPITNYNNCTKKLPVQESNTHKPVTKTIDGVTPTTSHQIKSTVSSKPSEFTDCSQPISNIYNKYVENDLSWMENIRYVREINAEEHDATLIFDDSFWENFTMPINWNERDFEYF